MHHVRGNHDAMITDTIAATGPFAVELAGVTLAVLDTVRPGYRSRPRLRPSSSSGSTRSRRHATTPVLVFGHHHPWDPQLAERNDTYFGINPDDSDALCAVIARRESIGGYFAGHTHRNRVRRFPQARNVPIVESRVREGLSRARGPSTACTRADTPSSCGASRRPAAMAWTEKTRHMFAGLYRDYALGRLADRCFTQAF